MSAAASAPRRRPGRGRRLLLAVALVAFACWASGLVHFISRIPDPRQADDGRADAIVVLTGGAERLREGLRLLARDRAPWLFVSGVHRDATLEELLAFVPEYGTDSQAARAIACCVVLGRAAGDTAGNARETATWLSGEHLRSILLVTADYHMPRSLLEFHRALPGAEIKPHAVFPERPLRRNWWRNPPAFARLIVEYHKYLLALVRGLLEPAVVEPEEAPTTALGVAPIPSLGGGRQRSRTGHRAGRAAPARVAGKASRRQKCYCE